MTVPPLAAQVLPLGPPETQFWSPYSGTDALCGHPLMIPLEELVSEGLMDSSELPPKTSSSEPADFNAVNEFREPLLVKVADRLLSDSKHAELRKQMDAFRTENAWVEVGPLPPPLPILLPQAPARKQACTSLPSSLHPSVLPFHSGMWLQLHEAASDE